MHPVGASNSTQTIVKATSEKEIAFCDLIHSKLRYADKIFPNPFSII